MKRYEKSTKKGSHARWKHPYGVNGGYHEMLGARIADGEDELFWSGLFQDLKDRGLSRVKLVKSDGHKGIQKAVEKSFLGASWQICHVHLVRAVLRNVAKGYSQMFK